MSEVMIEAQGLTKRYGQQRALDNASFNVSRGEIVGFLGPNGAGKSTTMKILTCFIAPSEGTARVNGCDIWADPIGVFRLTIEKPSRNAEVATCRTDLVVASPLQLEWSARDHSHEDDLVVLFAE